MRGWKYKGQGGALNVPSEVSIHNNKNIFVKNEVTVCGSSQSRAEVKYTRRQSVSYL